MPQPNRTQLVRGLTLIAAISIVVGNVIGTGVFLKARVMTCNVGTPWMVLTVYIIAGLLSLAGALSYAELAAMMPSAGGEYVFLREAYGPRWAFLYGWMSFFIGKAGSQAALGVQFASFLNITLGGMLAGVYFAPKVFGYPVPVGPLQLVALASIVIVTAINCLAVKVSGAVAAVLTAIKISVVLLVGIGAFIFARGADWSHFAQSNIGGACEGVSAVARAGFAGFVAAMMGALWAYDGWNNVTLVAGEVQNPQRNLPRALIGGMLLIVGLYVMVNFAYFYTLSPTTIANVSTASSVATEVAKTFLGPFAVTLIAVALLSSTFGTLHTSILTGARVPYAMSHDRLFFKGLSKVSQRTHVPIGALIAQAVWAIILIIIFSSSFDILTDYAIFGLWIFYALVTASVFVLRRRMPDHPRPYRTWGYPVVPILFIIAAAVLLSKTLWDVRGDAVMGLSLIAHGSVGAGIITIAKDPPLFGIILIALGFPVYWYWSRHNLRTEL